MRYNLFTDALGDGRIFQTLKAIDDEFENPTTVLGRWVIRTRDAEIEKALVSLGWTPPGQKDYRDVCGAYGGDCGGGENCSFECFESVVPDLKKEVVRKKQVRLLISLYEGGGEELAIKFLLNEEELLLNTIDATSILRNMLTKMVEKIIQRYADGHK